MDYHDVSQSGSGNVRFGGISTEYATAALVFACLVALIVVRRGFRGVSIPGVGSVGVG